jgi:hypothetical protein
MISGMLARVGLAVVAVAALAWLGVLLRDARLAGDARERAFSPGGQDPARLASVDRDLRRANLLNPATENDMVRARFALLARRPAHGIDLAESVLAREPENLDGWAVLLSAARGSDPARERRALAALTRLDPIDARRAR